MSENQKKWKFADDIDVEFVGDDLTDHELERLEECNLVSIVSTNNYEVTRLRLNTSELANLGFEYSILKNVANSVEVEAMRYIRQSPNNRVTTKEIKNALDRPASTISRTMNNLVDKGQVRKVQNGVYEKV